MGRVHGLPNSVYEGTSGGFPGLVVAQLSSDLFSCVSQRSLPWRTFETVVYGGSLREVAPSTRPLRASKQGCIKDPLVLLGNFFGPHRATVGLDMRERHTTTPVLPQDRFLRGELAAPDMLAGASSLEDHLTR